MKQLDHCPSMEALIDLSYGELDPAEAGPVQSHLEVCASCADEWASLLAAQRMASELPGGPMTPSPEIELRLKQLVVRPESLWERLAKRLWDTFSSPVPAYQAMLGGAAIVMVIQLVVSSSAPRPPEATPRAPDPAATTIKIIPVQDLSQPHPRQELEHTVDALPQDQMADLY